MENRILLMDFIIVSPKMQIQTTEDTEECTQRYTKGGVLAVTGIKKGRVNDPIYFFTVCISELLEAPIQKVSSWLSSFFP